MRADHLYFAAELGGQVFAGVSLGTPRIGAMEDALTAWRDEQVVDYTLASDVGPTVRDESETIFFGDNLADVLDHFRVTTVQQAICNHFPAWRLERWAQRFQKADHGLCFNNAES